MCIFQLIMEVNIHQELQQTIHTEMSKICMTSFYGIRELIVIASRDQKNFYPIKDCYSY
jgi:hypothetical protein